MFLIGFQLGKLTYKKETLTVHFSDKNKIFLTKWECRQKLAVQFEFNLNNIH